MAVETEVIPYVPHSEKGPIARNGEAEADLEKFCAKWADVLSDIDILPQPMRAIAEFVKKEVGGEIIEQTREGKL